VRERDRDRDSKERERKKKGEKQERKRQRTCTRDKVRSTDRKRVCFAMLWSAHTDRTTAKNNRGGEKGMGGWGEDGHTGWPANCKARSESTEPVVDVEEEDEGNFSFFSCVESLAMKMSRTNVVRVRSCGILGEVACKCMYKNMCTYIFSH